MACFLSDNLPLGQGWKGLDGEYNLRWVLQNAALMDTGDFTLPPRSSTPILVSELESLLDPGLDGVFIHSANVAG